jgi:hypothetical protein
MEWPEVDTDALTTMARQLADYLDHQRVVEQAIAKGNRWVQREF